MNNTTISLPREHFPLPQEIASFIETLNLVYLVSGIFIGLIAVITVFGNGLLLLAIIKDPFQSFRTPMTVFVVGLAMTDGFTGLIVDPLTAFISIASYLNLFRSNNPAILKLLEDCFKVNSYVSFTTMNASLQILLALTFCQYLAISFPHKHRTFVTRRNAIITVGAIVVYCIIFSLLLEYKVPSKVKLEIDVNLNTNIVLVALILCHILLYRAYCVHLNRVSNLDGNDAARKRRREQQRQFTSANLLLVTFLVLFTLPSVILWNLRLYKYNDRNSLSLSQDLRIKLAEVVTVNVLVLKFALDPFIYAWRLSKYRQAITSIIRCNSVAHEIDGGSSLRTISTFETEGNRGNYRGNPSQDGSVAICLTGKH